MIHAIVLALAIVSDGAAPNAVQPSREQISPVEVTANKLPDLGEPYEVRQRENEKLELPRREFEKLDLEEHRAIWAGKGVANYRFTVWTRGAWDCAGAIIVTVRNGTVASSEYVRDPLHPGVAGCEVRWAGVANAAPFDTIPNLFAIIANTLPSVQYDTQYGYPLWIAHSRQDISDEEFTIFIRDFEVLK